MKFSVSHTFQNISLEDYEKLYFDEEFNTALCEAVKLARTLGTLNRTETTIHREVTVGPDREVPAPVAKILGASRIEYTEHLDYTLGSYKGTWKTISSLMTDKVHSAGTFAFKAKGNGVERIVDGEIKVKIFGVGGMVEKFIVADIERSYAKAAEFTQNWIDKQG